MTKLNTQSISLQRRGSGPPLVLLHCLGVDHHFWDFAEDLARDFTLISYDLPGHGRSPVPAGAYTIEDLSAQLAELLARHKIARAHVAGISLGGLIAQHFAATRPDMVDRLTLIDTTPRYTDELRAMWAERAATARSAGVKALVDGLLKIWFTPQSVAGDTKAVRYVRTTLQKSSGEGYALACEALAEADLRTAAARITAPTLVICGDDDIPSFLDSARWLASNINGARLEWIGKARHASVIERPYEALAIMREFLR
ncbi:MAG TPA: alpha/beta fold hydrolase [Pseudolabrys sp.]|nr:alpha/beta fold hydrolase [Pseudolabrys sp.]